MSYKNKVYVSMDADNDLKYYNLMKVGHIIIKILYIRN